MNKKELVASLVGEVEGVAKKDAEAFVDAFKKIITETLAKGEKVSLSGLGTFETRARAERNVQVKPGHPEEGTKVAPASTGVGFIPSKALKDVVNK
jgi:DNA-binding protein HU-beta